MIYIHIYNSNICHSIRLGENNIPVQLEKLINMNNNFLNLRFM